MRAVWFIEKLELVLNCNNYENLNPKSRTSQTRKTLAVSLYEKNIFNLNDDIFLSEHFRTDKYE